MTVGDVSTKDIKITMASTVGLGPYAAREIAPPICPGLLWRCHIATLLQKDAQRYTRNKYILVRAQFMCYISCPSVKCNVNRRVHGMMRNYCNIHRVHSWHVDILIIPNCVISCCSYNIRFFQSFRLSGGNYMRNPTVMVIAMSAVGDSGAQHNRTYILRCYVSLMR